MPTYRTPGGHGRASASPYARPRRSKAPFVITAAVVAVALAVSLAFAFGGKDAGRDSAGGRAA